MRRKEGRKEGRMEGRKEGRRKEPELSSLLNSKEEFQVGRIRFEREGGEGFLVYVAYSTRARGDKHISTQVGKV